VRLSINAEKPFDYHLGLGAKLAPLRDSGGLVVASGNIGHSRGGIDPRLAHEGYDWAHRFDDDARERMLGDPASVAGLDAHRDFGTAVPTPDHFLPLLYLAGLADAGRASGGSTDVLVDGYAYGSLSMTAYTLDLPCHVDGGGPGAASELPADVPPDHSNI
jgi:4,5-DOPA dioxygenase extradiol